jgi:hypothetical protein
MIKKYLDFISESSNPPEPNAEGVSSIKLSDSEVQMITDEPVLSNLISQSKITLMGNDLHFYDQENIKDVLNQYFPEQIK